MESHELLELRSSVGSIVNENAQLKERISVLEKKNRQSGWIRLLFAIAACCFIFAWTQFGHTFSGVWMGIRDHDGHISAWLDDSGLQLKDKQGRVRAKLGLFEGGAPFFQMFSED
jgi:hypothetical protein